MQITSPIDVVSALITDSKGRILFLKRSHYNKSRAGAWQFPEGKTRLGERPINALRRELEEEIGGGKVIKKIGVFPFTLEVMGVTIKSKRHLYKAKAKRKIILCREHDRFEWMLPKEVLKHKLVVGIYEIIESMI